MSREPIGVDALLELSKSVFGDRDPAELFTRSRPIRLQKRGDRTVLEIDLPGARKDELEVIPHGDELLVAVRDARRRISLPASVAGRTVETARLSNGVLSITFEA